MANYSSLSSLLNRNIECFTFDSIASTNEYLSNLDFSRKTQVCITKEQTCGKGQYNRKWFASKDSSILMSIKYNFPLEVDLNGLSLVVGLAIIEVLEQNYTINGLKLKWPNDVYFKDKKLSGILLENSIQKNMQSVVIGLGLNNNLDKNFKCKTPWIDLTQILGSKQNQLKLSAKLITKIITFCQIFEKKQFATFLNKWQKYDYLLGKKARYKTNKTYFTGFIKGVKANGALIIQNKSNIKEIYSSRGLEIF